MNSSGVVKALGLAAQCSSEGWSVHALGVIVFAALACNPSAPVSETEAREAVQALAPSADPASEPNRDAGPRAPGSRAASVSPRFPSSAEGSRRRRRFEAFLPPQFPHQTLAFSRFRFARLEGEEVRVLSLEDFRPAARFEVVGASALVSLVGGSFLALGGDHVHRLSPLDWQARRFARAPRLGPTALLPSPEQSLYFSLYYWGISKLALFDLGQEEKRTELHGLLSVRAFRELPDFDSTALVRLRDDSLVYTAPGGLKRVDRRGKAHWLRAPELDGRVWALAPAGRVDQAWAATPTHAYRLSVRGQPEVVERWELPPRVVAFSAARTSVAWLSVERPGIDSLGLRVDVVSRKEPRHRALRFSERAIDAAGRPSVRRLAPELRLSRRGSWVAVRGREIRVFDWRRERQVWPDSGAIGQTSERLPGERREGSRAE